MPRPLIAILLLVALAAAGWFGVHRYAEYRVRSAFVEAGLSDEAAACMGRRLVQRLSLGQLHQLTELRGHSLHGLVKAARRIDDPRIVEVTSTSALLCTTGLAR